MIEPDTQSAAGAEAKIEISLSRLGHLFYSFDPSPFHERDLDQDAEEYIIGSAEEMPRHRPLCLVVHLAADQLPNPAVTDLGASIHNYFAYSAAAAVAPVISRRSYRFSQRLNSCENSRSLLERVPPRI
jgi:hypothetical protein